MGDWKMFDTRPVLVILSAICLAAPVQAAAGPAAESIAGGNRHCMQIGSFGAFSEMVASGVKELALSTPMPPEEMDAFMDDAQRIAEEHGVKVYREPELLVTDLFPSDVAAGQDVILIYKGKALDDYLALKKIKSSLTESGDYTGEVREGIARMFGRLLSYPDAVIEQKIRASGDRPDR